MLIKNNFITEKSVIRRYALMVLSLVALNCLASDEGYESDSGIESSYENEEAVRRSCRDFKNLAGPARPVHAFAIDPSSIDILSQTCDANLAIFIAENRRRTAAGKKPLTKQASWQNTIKQNKEYRRRQRNQKPFDLTGVTVLEDHYKKAGK